ncbi:hypothetical protein TrVE_jg10900 [Triparma verrucosa]|uniref:Uncharacterized protein n=1 Tax=Triparma verrucosa TaxID=1606542 RepID=A0A9W7KWH5_9STRA|nr:hypothetical protein TrVE_jg10900 [Triparma verrucosa]
MSSFANMGRKVRVTAVVLENIAPSEKEERGQFAAHPQRITPIPTVGAPQSKAKAAAKKSKGRGEGDGAAETVTLEQSRQEANEKRDKEAETRASKKKEDEQDWEGGGEVLETNVFKPYKPSKSTVGR